MINSRFARYFLEDLKSSQKSLHSIDEKFLHSFSAAVAATTQSLREGGTVFVCGNGGSAADADHLVGELVGRFLYDRAPLRAIALTGPSALMTAVGNDYGYTDVFARPLRGLGKTGDVLIGISTSGNSGNVVAAFEVAGELGIKTIAVTGQNRSRLSEMAEVTLQAPSRQTPRIQECHGLLIHSFCRAIEREMFPVSSTGDIPQNPIIDADDIPQIETLATALAGQKMVFTNGCFDVLHPGHIALLSASRRLGDVLVLGLNDDASVRNLKGTGRPLHPFADRAAVLAALRDVDYVIGFSEPTPARLIERLKPQVLVKGGDYTRDTIVGAGFVEQNGGQVVVFPLLKNFSSTRIINSSRALSPVLPATTSQQAGESTTAGFDQQSGQSGQSGRAEQSE